MGVQHLGDTGLRQEIQALWRAVRAVSRATLQNGAIGRAGLRVYGGGTITIQDGGGLNVIGGGSVNISGGGGVDIGVGGFLRGAGTFDWTGPETHKGNESHEGTITNTGPFINNGKATLNGDVEVKKTLDVTATSRLRGKVTLEAILEVLTTGLVKIGTAMTLNPTADGGSIVFGSGGSVRGTNGGVTVKAGGYDVVVASSGASMGKSGLALAVTDAVGFQMVGLPTITKTGVTAGTVWADTTGRLYRVV